MKQLLLYLLSFLMYSCISGEAKLNYKLAEGSKRKLEESKPNITSLPWEPIRIHYEFLQSTYDSKAMTFLKKVLDITTTLFQRYLLVQRTNSKITYKSSYPDQIFGFTISQELQNKEYDADLVLFINLENSFFASYLAYCGPAIFDEVTLRPIFGLVSWNIFYTELESMTNSVFETNVEIAVHEFIHGLGFIDDYFLSYYDSFTGESYNTSTTYEQSYVTYLSTPRITNFAQYHFNCTTLKGVQMEDNGGSGTRGSHFERSLFYNEIMTGSDMTGNFLITDFTFELLQDTGFYRIADYSPDQSMWGKNQGCEFAEKKCNGGSFSEFCTEDNSQGCSFYKTGVSKCTSEKLSGPCRYFYINSGFDCRDPDNIEAQKSSEFIQHFGFDSMCISGSVSKKETYSKFSCIQYKCDLNNKLSLVIEGQEFDCSKEENIKLPESYYGNITCPSNSSQFCQNRDGCPNLCSSKGFCMNKECVCMVGYSSDDCSVECTKYRYKGSCLDQCPDSTYVYENIKYCVGCPANCLTCTNYNQCTSCKLGYVLRGSFCDNYQLIDLLTGKLPISNSASNNSTSNSTNTDANSSDTQNNNNTNTNVDTTNDPITESNTNNTTTETNDTNTETNDTNTETNDTNTETNDTNTETNDTNTETNDTSTETNDTNTETNDTTTETNEEVDNTNTETNDTTTEVNEEVNNTNTEINNTNTDTNTNSSTNTFTNKNFNQTEKAQNSQGLIYLINIFLLAYF